ncbi:hypothetical protein AAG906_029613 [Vitis piasezkii]
MNTRGVDGRGQPFDLPTISPPPLATPLEISALPTLLKAKDAYPSLIVHSPKRPRRTQEELMDAANPPICQQE